MKTKSHDAMGQLLWDYYDQQDVTEIVERDDGYIDTGKIGPRIYFEDFKNWPAFERQAMKFARGRVLDIGCGAGRVGLHLQSKGHDVVGIDNSPLAVKVCRVRGLKDIRLMPVTKLDSRLGMFDTIVMYGNNFGLMGSYRRAKWLLRRFFKMTGEQGRIIAQSVDPYKTDAPWHKRYHARNRKRGRMGGQIRIRIRHRDCIGNWFDYLLVSQKELTNIVNDTGWRINRFIDSDGPYYMAIIDKLGRSQ